MSEPTSAELQETIDELKAYRQRLQDDVVAMGQKLKLPQARSNATLEEHPELQRLDEVLTQLASQLDAAAN